jgi:hypothetical protein
MGRQKKVQIFFLGKSGKSAGCGQEIRSLADMSADVGEAAI